MSSRTAQLGAPPFPSASAAAALLEAEGLRVTFAVGRNRLVAIDGVDLSVGRGETVGLVGESGSGKSTIARTLMRVYEPQQGSIRFEGVDITHASERALRPVRRRMQMVQQDPYSSLDPHMSIERVVGESLYPSGRIDSRKVRPQLVSLLAEVGLDEGTLGKRPEQFSGGQRQRIAIARAIAPGPDLLIADEPLSALDVSVQAQLVNLFRDMQERHGVAYLFISHDLALVHQIADRMVVVYLGRVVEEGGVDDVFLRPLHPYSVALLSSVPTRHTGRVGARIVLEGEPPSAISPPSGCSFHPRCPIARERCEHETPPLTAARDGQRVACFYPGELTLDRRRSDNGRGAALPSPAPRQAAAPPAAPAALAPAALAPADTAAPAPVAPAAAVAPVAPAPPVEQAAAAAGATPVADERAAEPDTAAPARQSGAGAAIARQLGRRVLQLAFTVLTVTTVLFFLLRLTGDPADVIAGQNASPQQLALIKAQYGLNLPLVEQYLHFLRMMVTLDFGNSYVSLQPALSEVWQGLWPTLGLASLAMAINIAVSVPLGCAIGAGRGRISRVLSFGVFVAQGIPFFVLGLVFIQVFSVEVHLLPSFGDASPRAWILPAVTLAWFVAPRLSLVIAVNVRAAMGQDFVRVARAAGAGRLTVIYRHALPNGLMGAAALAATQFAYLLSGTFIVEYIFGWPGIGQLLVNSVNRSDFPVVEAAVFVIAILVFVINAVTDVGLTMIDPRTRHPQAGR